MKPIKALNTFCGIYCATCLKSIVGKWTNSEIPRAQMRKEALDLGCVFDGHDTFCNEQCLRQKQNQSKKVLEQA